MMRNLLRILCTLGIFAVCFSQPRIDSQFHIAPKKAAGAVMGFVGVFSYVGAATQERISGYLIEKGTSIIDGVRHYDFSQVILFWVGASVVSLILAISLWNAKVRD